MNVAYLFIDKPTSSKHFIYEKWIFFFLFHCSISMGDYYDCRLPKGSTKVARWRWLQRHQRSAY